MVKTGSFNLKGHRMNSIPTTDLKTKAQELGFLSVGVSRADFLEEDAPRLEQWLKAGYHGSMSYMENHFDKRLDPRKLVPGATTVISVLYNYFPEKDLHQSGNFAPSTKFGSSGTTDTAGGPGGSQSTAGAPTGNFASSGTSHAPEEAPPPATYKISKYAYGEDYHTVVKDRLRDLGQWMRETYGDFQGRVFVDSAPVMDKSWARRSGLGWIGKNANLIAPRTGSFFFIGEWILDLPFEPDGPMTDHCGTCTRCIDACPTEAIVQPYVVDGSKCISHLTIELKDAIPTHFAGKMDDWIFGCDVCQDVCPWNRFATPHREPRFQPNAEWSEWGRRDWEELTDEVFTRVFKKSAVKRTKFSGLTRNIQFVQSRPTSDNGE